MPREFYLVPKNELQQMLQRFPDEEKTNIGGQSNLPLFMPLPGDVVPEDSHAGYIHRLREQAAKFLDTAKSSSLPPELLYALQQQLQRQYQTQLQSVQQTSDSLTEEQDIIDQTVIQILPVTIRDDANNLMKFLRRNIDISWSASGAIELRGRAVDVNIVELLKYMLMPDTKPSTLGVISVLQQIVALIPSLPFRFLKNKLARQHVYTATELDTKSRLEGMFTQGRSSTSSSSSDSPPVRRQKSPTHQMITRAKQKKMLGKGWIPFYSRNPGYKWMYN